MIKSTVLIYIVLFGMEVGGKTLPSANIRANAAPVQTSEELKLIIKETILQSQDIQKTTGTLAAVQIFNDSTGISEQLTATQNLTKTLDELVKSLKEITPPKIIPTPAYDERIENIERALQNISESINKQTTSGQQSIEQILQTLTESMIKQATTGQQSMERVLQNLTESMNKQTTTVERLIASTTLSSCDSAPDYVYWPVTKSCYKLHTEEVNWPAAEAACHAEGAYLAVINSHNEAQYLSHRIGQSFYVGVFKDFAGQWTTVTGETLEKAAGYIFWANKNEPYSGAEWRFATLNKDGLISRLMETTYPFICEKAP